MSSCLDWFFSSPARHRDLHSFPTRRSSDLERVEHGGVLAVHLIGHGASDACAVRYLDRDRKSTRLNSSHTVISYAVFCLKKKRQLMGRNWQDRMRVDSCITEGQV